MPDITNPRDAIADAKVTTANTSSVPTVAETEQLVEDISAKEAETTPTKTSKAKAKRLKPAAAKITDVTRIKAMLEEYRLMYDKPIVNDASRAAVLNKLVAIVMFVIKSGERAVVDELYHFFVKERRSCLSEEVVFRGISKLGNTTRMQVEVLYAAMMAAVRNRTAKVKTKINLDRVRSVLKNEKIVAYLSSKD